MFPLHNKTIESLSLDTPLGCMGECESFSMKASRTGALEYCGFANVKPVGEQTGSVNYYEFDWLASVVETSGFLSLSEHDEDGGVSTSGGTVIGVIFLDGRERVFTRDALNEPPIFWAVAKLIRSLLEKAEWGEAAYRKTFTDFESRRSG